MSIYMSRAELEEISEGLITAYANKFSNRVIQSIDIEHFITEFLMLRIEYASFAEDDAGRQDWFSGRWSNTTASTSGRKNYSLCFPERYHRT